MKSIYNHIEEILFIFFFLTLSACSEKQNESIEKDVYSKGIFLSDNDLQVNVSVNEEEKTATTIQISYIPNNSQKYISLVIPADNINTIDNKEIDNILIEHLKTKAAQSHTDFNNYIKSITHTGKFTERLESLIPFANYRVFVIPISNNGELAGPPCNKPFFFQTSVADVIQYRFESSVEFTDATNGILNIIPENNDVTYFRFYLTKKEYIEYTQEKQYTDESIIAGMFNYALSAGIAATGVDNATSVLQDLLLTGKQQIPLKDLNANTEYVYLIAAFKVPDLSHITLISNVTRGEFTTPEIHKKELKPLNFTTFDIKKITDTNFSVNIVPEDPNRPYLWMQGIYTRQLQQMSPMDLAEYLLHSNIYPWPDYFLYRGSISYPTVMSIAGNTYYVIAFATDGKEVTSEPTLVTFDTGTPPDPANTMFNVTPGISAPYSAKVTIYPSDNNSYYSFSLIPEKDNITDEAIKNDYQNRLTDFLEQTLAKTPGYDIAGLLPFYFFHGMAYDYEITDLTPQTNYSLCIFVINNEGKIAKFERYRNFITTTKLSDAKTVPTLIGVFSLKQVAEENILPELEKYKDIDAALVVTKYNFLGGGVQGQSVLIPKSFRETELDENKISDLTILQRIKGIESIANLSIQQPFSFSICTWNEAQVSLSYAFNDQGIIGKIDRSILTTPKKNQINTIDKLQVVINQIKQSSSTIENSTNNRISFDIRNNKKLPFELNRKTK